MINRRRWSARRRRRNGRVAYKASGSGANQILNGPSPNTTYLLTGWAKVANAGETLAIGAKNYGGTETFTNLATTSYTEAAVLFTTGSTNTQATISCWKNTGGTGAGFCDDIAVERPSTPANFLTNAGFESGALSSWALSASGSAVVSSNARTGTFSLQAGPSSNRCRAGPDRLKRLRSAGGAMAVALAESPLLEFLRCCGLTRVFRSMTPGSRRAVAAGLTCAC